MRADPQELVADAPSEIRRHGIGACVIEAAAAGCAQVGALVSGVKEHIGVEYQQLLFFHRAVECIAVVDVNQTAAAVPAWQGK